ncbi:MAG TPA: NmrA family transcriptional regulator, partial [Erythrobacter sp.]|nr:NmrA family transcriptional regulator [Erythrobacter sp.]
MQTVSTSNKPVLVLGGTGNSGRRIVERLRSRGLSVRVGSRSANPPFDWAREDTWDDALTGVSSIYISYAPDLAIPGAKDAIAALVWRAKLHGVKRLVLLSGRGEAEA